MVAWKVAKLAASMVYPMELSKVAETAVLWDDTTVAEMVTFLA